MFLAPNISISVGRYFSILITAYFMLSFLSLEHLDSSDKSERIVDFDSKLLVNDCFLILCFALHVHELVVQLLEHVERVSSDNWFFCNLDDFVVGYDFFLIFPQTHQHKGNQHHPDQKLKETWTTCRFVMNNDTVGGLTTLSVHLNYSEDSSK